jgi:hypothetical protein
VSGIKPSTSGIHTLACTGLTDPIGVTTATALNSRIVKRKLNRQFSIFLTQFPGNEIESDETMR